MSDPRVLEAFGEIPREEFVPDPYRSYAYLDRPIPLPHEQVTTQPSLVARMVEALSLRGEEAVLEIGTGYGYQTALLARLARFVWSLERWPELAGAARASLDRLGIGNVDIRVGDGTRGLPEHAPYQAILVSAAFPRVPPPLEEQLAAGGRLVQPIGQGGNERVVLFHRPPGGGALRPVRVLTGAHFVRLYGWHGFPEEEGS